MNSRRRVRRNTNAGVVNAATLCVFKHNNVESPSTSWRLVNGMLMRRLLPTAVRDIVTSGQVKTAGTKGVFKAISHASDAPL